MIEQRAAESAIRWHGLSVEETARRLHVDLQAGLSPDEARRRLERDGPNVLAERGGRAVWRMASEQLRQTLVVVLLVAAVVSWLTGDAKEAGAIFAIVLLNTALGVRQEYKAERALEALRKLSAPTATLKRGGRVVELPSAEVVAGDVMLLEAGDAVTADARLVEAANLRVDESALTGESEAVEKDAAATFEGEPPVGDRRNMVYRGSSVVYGRGVAVVVATGMRSELGRIAGLLESVEEEQTPLQRRLDRLGRILAAAALAIVAVVFVAGVARGEPWRLMFLTAVSLAVAAVPEGLPAVVTIALALGAQRMLSRNALIRRLPAVETLGSVTVICSDKTGTLTENRMTVRAASLPERAFDGLQGDAAAAPELRELWTAAALCNDAALDPDGERATGDPTEAALVEAAARAGLRKPELERALPRVAEAPFDSVRKRMTTVHRSPAGVVAYAKGALDSILPICESVETAAGVEALDPVWRERIEQTHDRIAEAGMRVLAFARRDAPADGDIAGGAATLERGMRFLGLVGMLDPPRAEAAEAVRRCRSAGIRTVMITGDHPKTAAAVARELGVGDGGRAVAGVEMDGLSDEDMAALAAEAGIYARVSPEHKLRIIDALASQGHVVAMTGDGVNDAPALKRADIGVAMGLVGSDVAKQAADIVLRDDNFATIVAAVEQGRVIFDNIRKFLHYLLSANCGELWVMFAGPLTGLPIPLLPLQILWMNLATDGPPALALSVEPAERGVMKRPPYPLDESVFSRGLGRDIVWSGLWLGTLSLAAGWWVWRDGSEAWRTVIFTSLVFGQMARALSVRSWTESLFTLGLRSNPALLGAVGVSTALHLAVVYWAPLRDIFETRPLGAVELSLCAGVAVTIFLTVEAQKALRRRDRKREKGAA